jgi:hypothetical protein
MVKYYKLNVLSLLILITVMIKCIMLPGWLNAIIK